MNSALEALGMARWTLDLIIAALHSVGSSKEMLAQCRWALLNFTASSMLFAGLQEHVSTLNGQLPASTLSGLGQLSNLDLNYVVSLFNLRASLADTSKTPFVDFLWQFICLAPLISGCFSDGAFSFAWAQTDSDGKPSGTLPFRGSKEITSDLLVTMALLYDAKDILSDAQLHRWRHFRPLGLFRRSSGRWQW